MNPDHGFPVTSPPCTRRRARRSPTGGAVAADIGIALALVTPSVLLWLVSMVPFSAWELDLICTRSGIEAGELWRLFTGHFVHLSLSHLLWDGIAFLALCAVCLRMSRRRTLVCLVTAAATVPLVLWLPGPVFDGYFGLSGLDSALFGLLAITLLARSIRAREPAAIALSGLLSLGFVAKIAYEAGFAATVFVADMPGVEPLPLAHVVGFAVGALVALLPGRTS